MPHIQSQTEWEAGMGEKILKLIQKELYMELRFLDVPLSALKWQAEPSLPAFATDGRELYYSPQHLLRVFPANPKFLSRAYLHTTLHCVFSHLWLRGNREKRHWNAACDIAVEYVIDGMGKDCTRRPLTWLRQKTYETMDREKMVSAAEIYRFLKTCSEDEVRDIELEFYTDSHRYWPQEEKGTPRENQAKDMWDKISRQSQMEMERRGKEPEEGEELLERQLRARKSRRSYRKFLKKFAVYHEELHCDPDEFDLNYYTYGLKLYGNMPLIEPVESRETRKIQEFVIVVDTSYSTDGELVKNFLKETSAILTQPGRFFRRCNIRILQCDDAVRTEQVITDTGELEKMLQHFTLVGGGGTDFRPAFSYVNELIDSGELKELRGLLYFTDGKGIYPAKRPVYDTAFLFLDEFEEEAVPPWAMRLRLEPEEFEK